MAIFLNSVTPNPSPKIRDGQQDCTVILQLLGLFGCGITVAIVRFWRRIVFRGSLHLSLDVMTSLVEQEFPVRSGLGDLQQLPCLSYHFAWVVAFDLIPPAGSQRLWRSLEWP
jgi:hypothetical protein